MQSVAANTRQSATAILILGFFGAVWILLALLVRQSLASLALLIPVSGLLVAVAAAAQLRRRVRHLPPTPDDPARARTFLWINVVTWTAVPLANLLLHVLGHEDAFLPVLACIVGLHFIPLGRLFGSNAHIVTGLLMTLWASICLLVVPADNCSSITAVGCALLLWHSAALRWSAAIETLRSQPLHHPVLAV